MSAEDQASADQVSPDAGQPAERPEDQAVERSHDQSVDLSTLSGDTPQRVAQEAKRSTAQERSGNRVERPWLRAGLACASAWGVLRIGHHLGPHLKTGDFYALAVAVGLSVYHARLIRLRPPSDDRSRLRALWLPEQKRVAVWCTLALVLVSALYLGDRLTQKAPRLTYQHIEALKPIGRGLHIVSGTPRPDQQDYRWAFTRDGSLDAPHLTPLREFKGHLLVISDRALTEPLADQRGWLSEISPLSRTQYKSYRRHMGLSDEALLYLFDLRGVWWLDPYGFAALLVSLLSFLITLGSPTRDPQNQSRILFIPPELRAHLNDVEGSARGETRDEAHDASSAPTPPKDLKEPRECSSGEAEDNAEDLTQGS